MTLRNTEISFFLATACPHQLQRGKRFSRESIMIELLCFEGTQRTKERSLSSPRVVCVEGGRSLTGGDNARARACSEDLAFSRAHYRARRFVGTAVGVLELLIAARAMSST